MIEFEKQICNFLGLPSIPVKKWDGKRSFEKGVAVLEMLNGGQSYAVASFDAEKDEEPQVKKTFSIEPFSRIVEIFVVPSYMDTDVEDADLDNESKKAAQRLVEEAKELEEKGVESESMKDMKALPEWVFPEITNADQAKAYIQAYNQRNKIRGKLPKNEETLKLRLLTIYNEIKEKENK